MRLNPEEFLSGNDSDCPLISFSRELAVNRMKLLMWLRAIVVILMLTARAGALSDSMETVGSPNIY